MIKYQGVLYRESETRAQLEARWRLVKPYLEKYEASHRRRDLEVLVTKYKTYNEVMADDSVSEDDKDWLESAYEAAFDQLKYRSFL